MRLIEAVGVVGCGRMGSAIAGHLVRQGIKVIAADPEPAALARATALGARAMPDSASLAADSDLVLVVVVNDDQVVAAVAGEGGILEGARPGTIIAICASIRPDTARELAGIAQQKDVHVIDVALVRGERGAEEGRLALMCGGPEEVIRHCEPTFSAFASDVCHLGDVGSGQVAKTANNILLWACIRADLEALRLGRALGVDPARLREAIAVGSGANRPLSEWGKHRLRWPHKDLEVALGLAQDAGVHVPLVETLPELIGELTVDDLTELI
jgi:3-hydroxyisobutyrate dehydrogenase